VAKLQELIQAEAEQVEADEAEEEAEADEHGQPAEPTEEPAAPVTEADFEKAFASLEKEAERHAREVSKRAGPFLAELKPCPLCFTPGFAIAVPAGEFDPLRRAAALALMGDAPEADYQVAEDAEACPTCDALGLVLTGSKVPDQKTKLCIMCNGRGWRSAVAPAVLPYGTAASPTAAAAPGLAWPMPAPASAPAGPYPGYGISFVPLPGGVEDAWQRPAGHPHWGLDPAVAGNSNSG